MNKILVTGSQGFIGSYICTELLNKGYKVLGVDSYEKYGYLVRSHDNHPNFTFKRLDVIKNCNLLEEIFFEYKPQKMIQACAKIGGIEYFSKKAYDLVAANDRIMANCFDLAIEGYKQEWFNRIIVLSSSMVYESTVNYPTPEEDVLISPPPISTYGFSKLNAENYCHGAFQQYGLPYTICRPFNCIGLGEEEAKTDGNTKSMLSHVVPDLIVKTLKCKGEPLHILGQGNQIRCYTHGKDIARGVVVAMESMVAIGEEFNISTSRHHTVLEVAKLIWDRIYPNKEFKYISDYPFQHDVQKRIPCVEKAKKMLGFEANITLEETLDELIEHFKENI